MTPLQTVVSTVVSPSRGLAAAADERRFVLPLLLATLIALGFTLTMQPRLDYDQMISQQLEHSERGAQMSPHEREQAVEMGKKFGAVSAYGGALFGPTFMVLAAAFFLWIGF